MAFEDYTIKCKKELGDACLKWLEEASAEVEAETKRSSRVRTGQTRGSYEHKVDASALEAVVGSPEENAIWEEFGTGEYALNGDGRKGGWFYEDEYGQGHWTHGKTPNQPLKKAFEKLKPKIEKRAEAIFRGLDNG